MKRLVPLLGVINKSFPAGIMDVLLGLAAILKHTYELNLFFNFHTPLGRSNSSTKFGMSSIICGEPCTVNKGNHLVISGGINGCSGGFGGHFNTHL